AVIALDELAGLQLEQSLVNRAAAGRCGRDNLADLFGAALDEREDFGLHRGEVGSFLNFAGLLGRRGGGQAESVGLAGTGFAGLLLGLHLLFGRESVSGTGAADDPAAVVVGRTEDRFDGGPVGIQRSGLVTEW